MGTLVPFIIGGVTFSLGVASGLALATSGALMCGAVRQCRRRSEERAETEPPRREA